ncbi:MAG: carboxylesterase family protein [Myxococcales bacterium]|nr:carboxylesterase family protein [Myxococcales bacterium]
MRGATFDGGVRFLGVRYATAGRWEDAAPVQAAASASVVEAPAPCAQSLPDGGVWGVEDCLRANLWAPRDAPDGGAPVIVFVHGGDNISGAINDGLPAGLAYDGTAFATRGAVVVVVSYRLGVFGFLAHPALTRDGGAAGNYALGDLVQALTLVRGERLSATPGSRSACLERFAG